MSIKNYDENYITVSKLEVGDRVRLPLSEFRTRECSVIAITSNRGGYKTINTDNGDFYLHGRKLVMVITGENPHR